MNDRLIDLVHEAKGKIGLPYQQGHLMIEMAHPNTFEF